MRPDEPATEAYAYPLLLKQLWHSALAIAPDQEIVYRDRRRLRYRALRERVGRLAGVLAGLGVQPGDTVAVMDWDSHRYLECFYAVPMMGAVLLTVNVRLSPEQILYTLNHARPRLLVLNEEFLPVFRELRPKLETVRELIWISDEANPAPADLPCAGDYEALVARAAPDFAFADFDENTRATTFYTTGTTGLPKGVFYSHRQLVLHTLGAMAALAAPATGQHFHRGDVFMPIAPMFHAHGWSLPMVALLLGVKQVYAGRYVPETLLALIEREGVTFCCCVPTLLQMLLSAPGSARVDLSRLKLVIGGSALPVGLARAARARGIDVFGGYGMSETGPLLTLAQLHPPLGALDEDAELHFRTKAGAPLPLVELRTVDENLRDVPAEPGSSGEVVARAPWLTQGYLAQSAASAELWRGGYLHTRDLGFLERGYLKVTDRVKDVIKTGGEWISSVQLEDLISQHPAVAEVAVIGVPDAKWGERPLALVVPRPGASVTETELRQLLGPLADAGVISKWAVPDRILCVAAIAKTSVGKFDKKHLREQYAHYGST